MFDNLEGGHVNPIDGKFEAEAVRDWTPAQLDAISFLGLLSAFFVENFFTIKDVKQEFSKGGGLLSNLTQEDIDGVPALLALDIQVDDVLDVGYWFATNIDDDANEFDAVAPKMNRLRKVII